MNTPLAAPAAASISIVTPSYNQAPFIEATLRSVLEQDYPHLEQIVIDGGSTDGTVAILRRYGERYRETRLRWLSEPDEGQADAINKGLRLARGEIMAYLNSDDTYLPGALAAVAAWFREHPEVGLLYGDCRVIDAQGRFLRDMPGHPFSLQRLIQRAEFIPQQAAFWRRSVWEEIGGFDTGLHYALDYDFFVRAAKVCRVAYLPMPLACFRLHGASKTATQEERHWREALTVSRRHGLRPTMPWYWLRLLRHRGLRALPAPLQQWLRRRMARPQDPRAWEVEETAR